MLTTQLSIMTQAGVDLAEALQSAADQSANENLKNVLLDVHEAVSSGLGFSEALSRHVNVFGEAYVASMTAGEASGTLSDVLARQVELIGNDIRMRATLKSVLTYPIVLSAVAVLVIGALVFVVLPQFQGIFENMGKPVPVYTQLLLDSSEFLRVHGWKAGIGLLVAGCVALKLSRGGNLLALWDRFALTSRLLGKATQALLTGRSFRLLGTMLESDITVLEGVRLCRTSVRNQLFRGLFDDIESSITNGRSMGPVILECPYVPQAAAQMVVTAERTGRLGPVLLMIGEFYEQEGERRLRDITKLLEPAIIVVMGGIVAFVVMSVMLPLLDVSAGPH